MGIEPIEVSQVVMCLVWEHERGAERSLSVAPRTSPGVRLPARPSFRSVFWGGSVCFIAGFLVGGLATFARSRLQCGREFFFPCECGL